MNPVLTVIPGVLAVHAYAFFMSAGFAAGSLLALRRARLIGLEEDRVLSLLIGIFLASLFGARAFFVWEAWAYYVPRMWEIPMIWRGGLSFYGGLIGGLLAVAAGSLRMGLPVCAMLDLMVPSVAIGHALGRVGCMFHGCCFGKMTDSPFGVAFSDGLLRHPTQAYEGAALAVLFVLALIGQEWPRKARAEGALVGWYLTTYGAVRFGLELLRDDMVGPVFAGLLRYQWVSVVMMVLGLVLWIGSRRAPAPVSAAVVEEVLVAEAAVAR